MADNLIQVIAIDVVHDVLQSRLESEGFEFIDCSSISRDEIIKLYSNVQGMVVRSRFELNEEFLSHFKRLEFIARSGAGMENIDESYCISKRITLFNAPEGNRNAVAEHALGMLLNLFNNLNKADQEIKKGIWDREGNRGEELEGKTIGLIGYGNNGCAFAKILAGFDVKVLAFDKYKTGFSDSVVQEVGLSQLKSEANIISLHIPQTEETIGLIDKEFIDSVKQPFYLINLSRGKIVSTSDLVVGLTSNKILGACLDVLEFEKSSFENMFVESEEMPIAFKSILESDKVLLSPHVGGWTHQSYFKLSNVLADKILAHYRLRQ